MTRPLRAAAVQAGDSGTPNLWAGQGWAAVTTEPAELVVRHLTSELDGTIGATA